eukprot:s551_g18.t1
MPKQFLLCDLSRFTQGCAASGPLVSDLWCSFAISTRVIAYLDAFNQVRLLSACIVLQVYRSEVQLGATALRLGTPNQVFSVPTPPLQRYRYSSVVSTAPPWWGSDSDDHELSIQ